jgi:hypothetical protein
VQLSPDQVFTVVAETRLAVPIVRRARRETGWIWNCILADFGLGVIDAVWNEKLIW